MNNTNGGSRGEGFTGSQQTPFYDKLGIFEQVKRQLTRKFRGANKLLTNEVINFNLKCS